MGEVVRFRRKKLSGFIPSEEDVLAALKFDQAAINEAHRVPDTAPSEVNPDSGDCA